ncbi:MAG: TAXI family TRAP transporter solute-binding subunit [Dehalobacterium sp.]
MKQKLLVTFLTVLLTLILVLIVGCGGGSQNTDSANTEPAAPQEKLDISYLGGTFGENLAFALAGAEIATKYEPGVNASIVKSAGSEMNTIMASTMAPNSVMYHTTSMDFIASYFGNPPWDESYPKQRLLTSYNPGCLAFVTKIANAKIEEMAGKTLSVLPLPSLQLPFAEKVLELMGMTGKIKLVQLDFGANEDALRDGTIDGLLCSIYNPAGAEKLSPAMEEVRYALKDELYWVNIPKDVVAEAAASLNSGFGVREIMPNKIMMPKETRSTWAQTVVFSALAVHQDMDEDLAYRLTKVICEHTDEFVNYDSGGEFVNPESIVNAMSYASEEMIHPGAVKYYKEVGLWDTYLKAREDFVANMGDYK